MDDSHPDLYTFRSDPASRRRVQASVQRPSRLGQTLREARRYLHLELEDLAEITQIRSSHLEALEAGRFTELPGDPHGKNFVRRYAQAVGLDPARALILYAQERRSLTKQDEPTGFELPPEDGTAFFNHPLLGRFARLLASLLLVTLAIWLALRAFDGALTAAPAQPGVQTPRTGAESVLETLPTPVETPQATTPETATAPTMVLFSLRTTPPGAEVSIDGYRFGQSPIIDAPVRAGNRTLKVERGGYGSFERTLDLSQDSNLNVTLFPKGAGKPILTGTASTETQPETAPSQFAAAATTAQVVVTVSAEAWLEVYRGSARGEGERLVYEIAEPGSVYSFTAPVYVFSGNAGGVSVAQGNAPAQPLGASGAVVGEAY